MESIRSEEYIELFNRLDDRKKLYALYYYIGSAINKSDFDKLSYIQEKLLPQISNIKIIYYYLLILLVYGGELFDKLKQSYNNNDTYEVLVDKLIQKLENKESVFYIDYKLSFTVLKIMNNHYKNENINNFITLFNKDNTRTDIYKFKLEPEEKNLLNIILYTSFDNQPIIPNDLNLPSNVSNNVAISEFYTYMGIGGKKKSKGRKVLKKYPKKK